MNDEQIGCRARDFAHEFLSEWIKETADTRDEIPRKIDPESLFYPPFHMMAFKFFEKDKDMSSGDIDDVARRFELFILSAKNFINEFLPWWVDSKIQAEYNAPDKTGARHTSQTKSIHDILYMPIYRKCDSRIVGHVSVRLYEHYRNTLKKSGGKS